MQLATLLSQKKAAILGRWLTMIYDSYPPETAIFLRKEKNRFDNPAGYRISEGWKGYTAPPAGMERISLTCLDEIIRIRALQNFTPPRPWPSSSVENCHPRGTAEEIRKENLAAELWIWSPESTGWPCWASMSIPSGGKRSTKSSRRGEEKGQRLMRKPASLKTAYCSVGSKR